MMGNNRGQSLFEVVVALAICTLVIVAVVSLTAASVKNTSFSRDKTLSSRYSQEATEWLRSQRDTNFTIFNQFSADGTTLCLPTLSFNLGLIRSCQSSEKISGTPFIREVKFYRTLTLDFPPKTIIEADVNVYWNDSLGYHEVRSATNFTDWRQN